MRSLKQADANGPRKAANLSLSEKLLSEAKALGINLSKAAERGIGEAIAERRAAEWLAENRSALDSSNDYVEKHGLPLARHKQF